MAAYANESVDWMDTHNKVSDPDSEYTKRLNRLTAGLKEADDAGYDFLRSNGKNPWGMVFAFEKFLTLDAGDTVELATRRGIFGEDVIFPANIRY